MTRRSPLQFAPSTPRGRAAAASRPEPPRGSRIASAAARPAGVPIPAAARPAAADMPSSRRRENRVFSPRSSSREAESSRVRSLPFGPDEARARGPRSPHAVANRFTREPTVRRFQAVVHRADDRADAARSPRPAGPTVAREVLLLPGGGNPPLIGRTGDRRAFRGANAGGRGGRRGRRGRGGCRSGWARCRACA